MSAELIRQRRLRLAQTAVLSGIVVWLASRAAAILMGPVGAWVALALVAGVTIHSLSSQRFLLPQGTRRVRWGDAPELHAALQDLVTRAGLESIPPVYVVPSQQPIALTTGWGDHTMLVVSTGLLQTLSWRELRAVLAHEIWHLRNHDLPLFAVVGAMQRVTRIVSGVLMVIVLMSFPLLLFGMAILPPQAMLYLGLVPLVSVFAQMALLRTREFQADLGAAELTGDPEALASALTRIERAQRPFWSMIATGTRGGAGGGGLGNLLRTHPTTQERIEHLRAL